MNTPRKVVLRQSLVRPILLGGADRDLTMIVGSFAAALIFGVGSKEAVVMGLLLWFIGHWGLVQLAKVDPHMRDVARRHFIYKKYYPAQTSHSAPSAIVKYYKP